MKRLRVGILLALASFCTHAELIEDSPKECAYCESWNAPQEPFQVYGNTWYVGTKGLAALLVVTDSGLILIDGALAQSASLIDANIRQTGFDPLNIKYILNSHAHYDHAGGIAALQKHTGAQVLASEDSVTVLQSGEVAANDPQFDFRVEANRVPAVNNVSLIADRQTLTLGNTTLKAWYTPGHTPGGTTWTWQSCEQSKCLDIVYADSLSAVSAEGFRFSDTATNPNARQIRASTALIRELPCDILLAPHPFLISMDDKLAAGAMDPATNPFIVPGECVAYADNFDDWVARRLEEEAVEASE